MATSKELLTSQQFAERAAVSSSTVSKWLREGKIKGIKQGGKWMISADQLPRKTASQRTVADKKSAVKPKTVVSEKPAGVKHQPGYSVEQFSQLTYLTPFGVERYLKEGRLNGAKDSSGKWIVDAANLEKGDIKRLVR